MKTYIMSLGTDVWVDVEKDYQVIPYAPIDTTSKYLYRYNAIAKKIAS